jgi:hypothetical protein|tara:strand:- start:293 stop:658 length:366 start_codon:yes stop_codon:yes gene_type:complete
MLSYKLFQSGLSELTVQSLCSDIGTGIEAAGTSKSDAKELSNHVNVVETVASGAGVILYASSVPVDSQIIFNSGANPLLVYPVSGAKINNLSTDAGVILPINTVMNLIMVSSTQHIAILSA